jgi:hypothetical protein
MGTGSGADGPDGPPNGSGSQARSVLEPCQIFEVLRKNVTADAPLSVVRQFRAAARTLLRSMGATPLLAWFCSRNRA